MLTSNKPDNCLGAVLPAAIQGFKDDIFSEINVGLPVSRNKNTDNLFDVVNALQLAEAKLALSEIARTKAEAANNAKSDFLMNMSHEIRTPIGAIIGLAQILLKTKLDSKQAECLGVLQESAEALIAMINKTLDIGKIESGTIDLEMAPFNLAVLLRRIVSIMSVKAQEKGIGLTLNYADDFSEIFVGDSGRIGQIVMNLVGNAIKFTETGEVIVSLVASEVEKDRVIISVADTGIGIDDDKLDIIFDKFNQAHCAIGRKYGGTGLGLAISKTLAESMGGSITVDSIPGRGTTFIFSFRTPKNTGEEETASHGPENAIKLDNRTTIKIAAPSLLVQ